MSPVTIAVVLRKEVYESNKWVSLEIVRSDPRVDVKYFVVDYYPDKTPYIVLKPTLFKDDRVVVVSAVDDIFVNLVINEEVANRTLFSTGIQLFVPHLRSDKESSHRRERKYNESIELFDDEGEGETFDEVPCDEEEEEDEEIYTAHHAICMLSAKMPTYFLEPHSNVQTTKSKPLDMMIVFMQFVIESLMETFGNLRDSAVVINFPDSGAKNRYKHIESLLKKMKLNYYLIAVDKVRTGTNKDSKTKSTLLIDPEQLDDIRQYERVIAISVDDLTATGNTLVDAARLTRDKILGENDNKKVTTVLCPFHFHPIRDTDTGRFEAADRFDALIDCGEIHSVFTSDSIPDVTCTLAESSKIKIIPMAAVSIFGIIEKEKLW